MPGLELLTETTKRPDAAIDAKVREVIADAETLWEPEKFQGEFPQRGLGIRRLRPMDCVAATFSGGMAATHYWSYSIATAATWETWIDVVLSDSCYVVVTGIFSLDATPNVTMVKFEIDGKEYPVNNIEEIYALDVARVYFNVPIAVRPEKRMTIKIIGKAAGTGSLGLLGYAIAKRSYLIGET